MTPQRWGYLLGRGGIGGLTPLGRARGVLSSQKKMSGRSERENYSRILKIPRFAKCRVRKRAGFVSTQSQVYFPSQVSRSFSKFAFNIGYFFYKMSTISNNKQYLGYFLGLPTRICGLACVPVVHLTSWCI